MGIATSATASAAPKAIVSGRSELPETTLTTGRAITALSTKSPRAASSERNTTHRETRSRVVVAVSLSDGTRNCGGGPGFGPTAKVKAPRTGCPSAEITRQKTRYQPSGTRRSGVRSVWGAPGALCGGPDVTWVPDALVTETIANRASIGSV